MVETVAVGNGVLVMVRVDKSVLLFSLEDFVEIAVGDEVLGVIKGSSTALLEVTNK